MFSACLKALIARCALVYSHFLLQQCYSWGHTKYVADSELSVEFEQQMHDNTRTAQVMCITLQAHKVRKSQIRNLVGSCVLQRCRAVMRGTVRSCFPCSELPASAICYATTTSNVNEGKYKMLSLKDSSRNSLSPFMLLHTFTSDTSCLSKSEKELVALTGTVKSTLSPPNNAATYKEVLFFSYLQKEQFLVFNMLGSICLFAIVSTMHQNMVFIWATDTQS